MIGWESEMHGLTAADEQEFYHRWYAPNNAVLVIAGDVTDPAKEKALAEKYYGVIPSRPVPARQRVDEPPKVASAVLSMKSPRVNEIEWSRQWLAPSYRKGDTKYAYALQVLAEVLGGSAASPLYKGLVVDHPLGARRPAHYYDPDEYRSRARSAFRRR